MRRKRFQKGSVGPRKHGRRKVWVAQWWEQGNKRSKVLGHYAEISKGQAHAMLAQILQPVNEGVGDRQTAVFTFKQYIQDAFLPVYRQKWKESTRSTSEPDIVRYLIPAFGDQLLSAISRNDMQRFLNQKAVSLSSSIVGHLRWHLNAIFKMAAGDGIVEFNPAQALFIPACKAAPTKRAMSKDEVRTALSVLDVRERLVFRMAVFDGMRPGEIFAIQFGKIRENSVFIDQRLYGSSNIDTPKGRKGKNTTRTVGLAPGTIEDLNIWKTFIGEHQGAMYLFSSETRVTPLRPNNHWKRNIRPRLEQFGLGWVNFQVLRRTNASLSRKAKVDDKVSADQRGHGLGVSLSVYAISDLDQKIEAVTKLESEVIDAEKDDDFEFVAQGKRHSKTGSKTKTE
jgi:integrase